MNIGFIGAGNMANAMINGLIKSEMTPNKIFVYDKNECKLNTLNERGISICDSEKMVAQTADLLILSIKPKDYEIVLNKIKDNFKENTIVIDIAPSIDLKFMKEHLSGQKVARIMPNTPASIGSAVSAVCFDDSLNQDDKDSVIKFATSFGTACEINEKEMGAFIGIAGSLPAYVFVFIEALADAAVREGMSRQKAYEIASAAVMGSAKMAMQSKEHVASLKDAVCSPSGTTIEAVYALEKNGFRKAIIEAVSAAANKGR